jgi:hypothetical protein
MSKYLNRTVVGIDVASAFSFASILCPDGSQFRKPFRINHTVEGFNYFLEQIKKAEEEYKLVPIRRTLRKKCLDYGYFFCIIYIRVGG